MSEIQVASKPRKVDVMRHLISQVAHFVRISLNPKTELLYTCWGGMKGTVQATLSMASNWDQTLPELSRGTRKTPGSGLRSKSELSSTKGREECVYSGQMASGA